MEMKTAYLATLEDIVFEGRNKAYGAYMLRKMYPKHVVQASVIAITASVLLFMAPSAVKKLLGRDDAPVSLKKKDDGGVHITPVDLTPVEPVTPLVTPPAPEPAATSQPTAKTITHTTPKVVDDAQPVEAEMPNVEDFKSADAGLTTSEGTGGAVGLNMGVDTGAGTGTGTGNVAVEAPAGTIFERVEVMPEFEGGMAGLMKYIGRELRYPAAAQRAGVEGTVVLSFVVGPTGEVTNITVLKGLGYGTEEEAIRVVKKLPRWKPGIQNGRAVPVRMTLPIRLQLK